MKLNLTFLLLLSTLSLLAQEKNTPVKTESKEMSISSSTNNQIIFGIQAGPSLTTIMGEYSTSWQRNYLIGLTGRILLLRYFAISVELGYERKGINSGHTPQGTGITFTIKEYFHYATGNALIELSGQKQRGGFAGVGTYTGHLLGRANVSQSDLNAKFDMGLLLRAGYFYTLKNGTQFRLFAGASRGFLTVDEDKGSQNFNRTIMMVAGVGF